MNLINIDGTILAIENYGWSFSELGDGNCHLYAIDQDEQPFKFEGDNARRAYEWLQSACVATFTDDTAEDDDSDCIEQTDYFSTNVSANSRYSANDTTMLAIHVESDDHDGGYFEVHIPRQEALIALGVWDADSVYGIENKAENENLQSVTYKVSLWILQDVGEGTSLVNRAANEVYMQPDGSVALDVDEAWAIGVHLNSGHAPKHDNWKRDLTEKEISNLQNN